MSEGVFSDDGHTTGPWSCDYGGEGVYSDTGAEVARVVPGVSDDGVPISGAEMESNQRLIAAAPDLLESIDQVCAALETLMAHYGHAMCEADRISRYAALGAARRAQANAEGFATWEEAINAWTMND